MNGGSSRKSLEVVVVQSRMTERQPRMERFDGSGRRLGCSVVYRRGLDYVFKLYLLGALLIGACSAQQCGTQADNALCLNSLCCSQFGFCGVGSDYCGSGCQSNCNSTATTTGEVCGVSANNTSCPENLCCSQFGFCGSTSEFCGSGCQSGQCDSLQTDNSSGFPLWAIIVIVLVAVGLLILGAVLIYCVKRRRRKQKESYPLSHHPLSALGGVISDTSSFSHPPGMTYIFSDNQKVLGMRFTYEFLSAATNGFSKELGRGAFGVVYKGLLTDDTEVAVKSLLDNHRGLKDFEAEIKTLGSINHANLVALRGFCLEPNKPAYIVYEFAKNGSLDKWIFSNENKIGLPWKARMDIARGTAKGLAYLHEDLQIGQAIIHLDIKPENILLDENFTPKVADFGMAKLIGEKKTLTIASGGTFGYMAPETYAGAATTKMDVYSFGMVLLELVCGRRHLMRSLLPNQEFYLPSWTLQKVQANEETDVVDPSLHGEFDTAEARRLLIIGLLCLQRDPDLRCDMGTVWKRIDGLIPVPEIPQELKAELQMVEKLLRRSSAENSVYSSVKRSTLSSTAFTLSSTGSARPSSYSLSSSSIESRGNVSGKTMDPSMTSVHETPPPVNTYRTSPSDQASR